MTLAEFRALCAAEILRFTGYAPECGETVVSVSDRKCLPYGDCAYRDLAYALYDADPPRIVVHKRLLRLPRQNVLGVIRHELGHVADPTPYALGAEQRADDVAESITGTKIRYDRRDVQTVGRGRYPRPLHLPR